MTITGHWMNYEWRMMIDSSASRYYTRYCCTQNKSDISIRTLSFPTHGLEGVYMIIYSGLNTDLLWTHLFLHRCYTGVGFGVTWWGMVASYIVIQIKSKIRHSSVLLPYSSTVQYHLQSIGYVNTQKANDRQLWFASASAYALSCSSEFGKLLYLLYRYCSLWSLAIVYDWHYVNQYCV